MGATFAVIAGEEIHRQQQSGRTHVRRVGRRITPYGQSGEIYLTDDAGTPLYFLTRYGPGIDKHTPCAVNYRANLYALKDLGVETVLGLGACGAITHAMQVGDLVVLSDLIDQTHRRQRTFFENCPLGFLRQFPVFCPSLSRQVQGALEAAGLPHRPEGIAAVTEGPRLETPAEVRMLATVGAQVVTHTFVPEVFLARELQLCYAGLGYVVNYAETGSHHRPFVAGALFGPMEDRPELGHLPRTLEALPAVLTHLADGLESLAREGCACREAMTRNVRTFGLPTDWRQWFADRLPAPREATAPLPPGRRHDVGTYVPADDRRAGRTASPEARP